MMEIKINILKGANKRVRGLHLDKINALDKYKIPSTGSTAHGWKDRV